MKYKLFSTVVAISLLGLFFIGGSGYHMSYYDGGPYSYSPVWSGSYSGIYNNYYTGYYPSYRSYGGYGIMSMMGWW